MLTKRCPCCGVEKPRTSEFFVVARRRYDGVGSYCRPCHSAKAMAWNALNRDRVKAATRRWRKRRYATDRTYRLREDFSEAIRDALKGKKQRRGWQKVVGYKASELKAHLERQFERGMSWDSYGDWHIDHIRPVSSFRLLLDDGAVDWSAVRECWSLANLRPLWAEKNVRKGAQGIYLI